ncbi:MAG TPA: DUF6348 family protein [Gemmataceae bacterium]|nr:DUF6348 family protein [Gemmataceae bacterium]
MVTTVPGSAECLNEFLGETFRAHGVATVAAEGGIRFPEYPGRWANGEAFALTEHAWQLDFRFGLEPGRMLWESVTGVGATDQDKMTDGMIAFAESSLHVILSALFGQPACHGTEREEWLVAGTPRVASIGPVRSRFGFPLTPDSTPDMRFFHYFAERLCEQPLSRGDHWVRLYQMREGERCVVNEVLLDNDAWPAVQDAMAAFDWPTRKNDPTSRSEHYDVRVFLVIRDADAV